jgi:predicted metal-dependent phosphoesterase TrpH
VDVHTLGYFFDPASDRLESFLAEQRRRRVQRFEEMVERLRAHGLDLDVDAVLEPARRDASKAVGRPWIARALVAAGHVASTAEAFDRWLALGRPAFVPRLAASPAEVIDRIHDAGGIASIAHPGLLNRDEWLPGFAEAGVDALEAYHSEHDADATSHYLEVADTLGLAVSGGSDYHADATHGGVTLGRVSLPDAAFQQLQSRHASRGRRAASRATASGAATSS